MEDRQDLSQKSDQKRLSRRDLAIHTDNTEDTSSLEHTHHTNNEFYASCGVNHDNFAPLDTAFNQCMREDVTGFIDLLIRERGPLC